MRKYQFTEEPFARAYMEHEGQSAELRVAYGMLESARFAEVTYEDNCMLPRVIVAIEDTATWFSFGSGIVHQDARYDDIIKKYPEDAEGLMELRKETADMDSGLRFIRQLSEADKRLRDSTAYWGGGWAGHSNPYFGKIPRLGTDGIRREIEYQRLQNPGKDEFYDAAAVCMDALDALGEVSRKEALKEAEKAEGEKKKELLRIAEEFTYLPKKPAKNFHEAVLVYWMFYTFDGVDSPGRFDQEMIGFYRNTPEKERLSILRRFLEGMHNVRGWNLCISGSDENWQDETNELSYDILALVTEMNYQTPNLTMRVHPGTPDKLWKMATACIATGTGLPAIYNDTVMCAALEKLGIPPEDSHDYCMNGCNQVDIMGKSHMGLEDGEVNLAKALELTLHNGYDYTGVPELISRPTGDPTKCNTFEEFLKLYYKQVDYLIERVVETSNLSQRNQADHAPNPMRSCLIEGCLEKGRDYRSGGSKYGHGQVLAEGMADAFDSLYAIRKLVYEEKKYTLEQLIEALKANFEGYERMRQDFASCEKFGNDIPSVDNLAGEVTAHFFAELKKHYTFRGGVFTGGCSPFNRAANNGIHTAALPNGKRNKEATFADSIAATPGCDCKGPTASILSMLHYDQTEACSGFVSQMKFDGPLFRSEKGQEAFIALAKTYFREGGQQLSINVLDRETLLNAMAEPEKHRNLVVRVGGYSDYFVNLTPELQQNVLNRTSFTI